MLNFLSDALTDHTQGFGLALAVLLPLVTAVAQRPIFTARKRALLGSGVSLLVGFLTVAAAGHLGDTSTLLTTLATVVAAAEASYEKVWQPLGVAPAIERATSPASDYRYGQY